MDSYLIIDYIITRLSNEWGVEGILEAEVAWFRKKNYWIQLQLKYCFFFFFFASGLLILLRSFWVASEAKGCNWLCQLLVFFWTRGYRERGREVGALYVCVLWGMGQVGNWLSIDSTCLIFISSLLTTVSVLWETSSFLLSPCGLHVY